jgi:hypothetical protein
LKLHDTIKCPCKDNPNRTGEIVFIHPDGLFCTVECTAPNGASVKAAGYKCVGKAGGLRWTGKRRPEVDLCPAQMKLKFERSDKEHE